MKSKICFILAVLFSCSLHAVEVTQEGSLTHTKRAWSEICLEDQRNVMRYFEKKLSAFLEKIGVPSFWNHEAEGGLLGSQSDYNTIHKQTTINTSNYAQQQQINIDGLLPTGFILGLGVSGSASFMASLESSALLTLIVVPYQLKTYDSVTGVTVINYGATWSIGGIGQQSAGAGAGGGLVVRGAVGIIWGDLPNASDLTGMAVGASGNVTAIEGFGFKIANVFNSTTHQNNLVAMATYDMGLELSTGVQGTMYYFMDASQIVQYVAGAQLDEITGVEAFQLPPSSS